MNTSPRRTACLPAMHSPGKPRQAAANMSSTRPGAAHAAMSLPSKAPAAAAAEKQKGRECCAQCFTFSTQQWREGPQGARTLCNACGVRYRKQLNQDKEQTNAGMAEHEENETPAAPPATPVSAQRLEGEPTEGVKQEPTVESPMQPLPPIDEPSMMPQPPLQDNLPTDAVQDVLPDEQPAVKQEPLATPSVATVPSHMFHDENGVIDLISDSDDDEEIPDSYSSQGIDHRPHQGQDTAGAKGCEDGSEDQQADGVVSIKSQVFEVFRTRPHGTWMTILEIVQEVVALGGAVTRSSNPESTINALLYCDKSVDGKNKSFLKRRTMHPGSAQEVSEFAMLCRMTCEGCKLPPDDTQKMMVCGCCKAAWHVNCHKGKGRVGLSVNSWFCSNRCAEKARSEKLKPKKQKKKPAGDVPQDSARKRKSAVPFDDMHEDGPQHSPRKRKSTVPFEELHKREPQHLVRERKSAVPHEDVQEEGHDKGMCDAILKAMRHWPPGEFLPCNTIVERIAEDQGSQPYSKSQVYRRLNKTEVFLTRGMGTNKQYAILEDLPCQQCGKQDDYNMILCSKCSSGWHLKCLPAKHRLKDIPEDDWDCPNCRQGHPDPPKRVAKAPLAKAAAEPSGNTKASQKGSIRGDPAQDARFFKIKWEGDESGDGLTRVAFYCNKGPRLLVVGKELSMCKSKFRYWSPASVEGVRLGVVTGSKEVTDWLSNSLGLSHSTDVPDHCTPSLRDIPEADFEIPPRFLKSDLPKDLRGRLPDAPDDDQPQQAAASSPAPAKTAVPGAAASSSAAATVPFPQEPLPWPSTASDGGHNGNDQSILDKRRRQCFKVLTTSGLDDSMYLKHVNRLDFDDAVELLAQAAQLADGVKRMVEKRIDDLSV